MAPLEPWEKVLVSENFLISSHGSVSCISCHGGEQSPDKETAHTGLVTHPSDDAATYCATCHADVVNSSQESLHSTLSGYKVSMYSRSIPENHPALDEAFGNHCSSCHTSCGDCHISQPDSVGGGFLSGHEFVETPPMTRTCTACHGSRVGNEYLGKNSEEIPGDVHFRIARMNCVSCHTGSALHASSVDTGNTRYTASQEPSCRGCHAEIGAAGDTVAQHSIHQDKVQCQVCHSIEYSSCDNCHVEISSKTGNPFYTTDAHYLGFYIGRNPIQSEERPYEYVTVRHIPIAPDSYSFYGEDLLPNFDLVATWAYATPHNIQRVTPQNQSCDACHGNSDLFLTVDKVKPEELDANKDVIVESIPE